MTVAPCTRLTPGTNIRCGAESMAVIHLTLNGASYLAYVCDIHYAESRQLEWDNHVNRVGTNPTPADDLLLRIDHTSATGPDASGWRPATDAERVAWETEGTPPGKVYRLVMGVGLMVRVGYPCPPNCAIDNPHTHN